MGDSRRCGFTRSELQIRPNGKHLDPLKEVPSRGAEGAVLLVSGFLLEGRGSRGGTLGPGPVTQVVGFLISTTANASMPNQDVDLVTWLDEASNTGGLVNGERHRNLPRWDLIREPLLDDRGIDKEAINDDLVLGNVVDGFEAHERIAGIHRNVGVWPQLKRNVGLLHHGNRLAGRGALGNVLHGHEDRHRLLLRCDVVFNPPDIVEQDEASENADHDGADKNESSTGTHRYLVCVR